MNRLEWATRYERNIVEYLEKHLPKKGEGVVMFDYYYFNSESNHPHRYDNFGELVLMAFNRNGSIKYCFIETNIVPLYVGKIILYKENLRYGDTIEHIIGDLYNDTKHLVKYWKIKRKIGSFLWHINLYHRYQLNKKLKRLDNE